jgi:hypothetical protein
MNPEPGLSAPEPKPALCHQLPVKSLLLHLEFSSYASYALFMHAVLGVTQVTRTVSPLIALNQSPWFEPSTTDWIDRLVRDRASSRRRCYKIRRSLGGKV